MILGIDTSLTVLSVALLDGSELVAAAAVRSEGSRNERLLPLIDALLQESGSSLDRVTRVVATRGPGSFTGTRVGLATAQGIALGRGVPMNALSTHEAVAALCDDGTSLVVSDAGRGEFYGSMWRGGLAALEPTLLTREQRDEILRRADRLVAVEDVASLHNVALLGARRIAAAETRGELARYQELTPLYVRLAEAEVKLQARNV